MKFILGKKLAMTQMWLGEEKKAVTRIQAGPCVVTQVKTKERDGYAALQLGFGSKSVKNLSKPLQGHFKNLGNFRYLREFRWLPTEPDMPQLAVGDVIKSGAFAAGETVKITGTSKGRGFAGVVKRHGFHGQDATHGNKDQLRMPGSIGSGGVQHVFKGMRMPGHLGDERVTISNVKVIAVDHANNEILLEGGVPGARGSLVLISGAGELKVASAKPEPEPEEVKTAAAVEAAQETAAENSSTEELQPTT